MFVSMPVVKPVIVIKAQFGQDCFTGETVPVTILVTK